MTKRKVRRFTAERRAAFLEHLRLSGNQAAARSVGFDRTVPEQRRRRDAAFVLECRAALEEASRRLAGTNGTHADQCEASVKFRMPGSGARASSPGTKHAG